MIGQLQTHGFKVLFEALPDVSFLPPHVISKDQAQGLDADGEVPWPQYLFGQHRHIGAVCTCEVPCASVADWPAQGKLQLVVLLSSASASTSGRHRPTAGKWLWCLVRGHFFLRNLQASSRDMAALCASQVTCAVVADWPAGSTWPQR